jgi:16S rRNA (guanine966-N2)-methyltransferase
MVFLDPPYATPDSTVHRVLDALVTQGWLGADAMVVAERPTRGPALVWPDGLTAERDRRYGEGTLWYGRARSG